MTSSGEDKNASDSASKIDPDVQPVEEEPASASAAEDFARQAEEKPPGLIAEFVDFLIHNKKWWLTPIILMLLLIGLLAWFSASPAAPFIYPW